MHLWVVQLTISSSCLLRDDPIHDIIRLNSDSGAGTHRNTQESTTQAPKRAYDSLLIWSSRSSKRPFSFYLKSLSSPNISVYFIQDLDMPLFKLLSFSGFSFCAFLFYFVLLFWILCFLGSRFCAKSNLWFGLVIFICFCGSFSFDFVLFIIFMK